MGSNQVALVTGASSGIGQATAELLAARGFTVFGTSRAPNQVTRSYTWLPLGVRSDASVEEEVRPFGVDVSLVEPAFVKTHIVSKPPIYPIAAYTPGRQAAMHALSMSVESGMEPRAVAQVILRAATTRPRLRYLVGRDAKGLILLKRLLPEPLFERVRRRVFRTGNPADQEPQRGPQETATS